MNTDDYLSKLPSFNRRKPKFEATLRALLEPLVAAKRLLEDLPSYFDLDTAIGAQLDVCGEWVGQSRYITIPIQDIWFAFDDNPHGFDKGIWRGPYDTGTSITRLDDETYRRLLRAIIAFNNWDGMFYSARDALTRFFNDQQTYVLLQNNDDGAITVGIAQKIPSIVDLYLLEDFYIPFKPTGVKTYHLITSVNFTPLFGFDVENPYIAGFDIGAYGVDVEYIAHNVV